MIDLTSVAYALLVLEQGSFRLTGQSLDVRTSVVSRRVRALEDAIGVALFNRTSKGVQGFKRRLPESGFSSADARSWMILRLSRERLPSTDGVKREDSVSVSSLRSRPAFLASYSTPSRGSGSSGTETAFQLANGAWPLATEAV